MVPSREEVIFLIYFFNLFFEVKNRIVLMNDLNSILSEKEKIDACDENQWSVLRIGVENLEKIKIVCDKYGKPTPTQLKLVYTVQKNQLQMKYKYDLVYSNVQDLDTHEIFMSWYEEVKKEVEG